jgi:alpha-tubulin suppressor-like RCC1 family protein
VAVGGTEFGQCDVADWREIVAVAAGSTHTLGLRVDGTVVAAGNNEHGQCDVTGWTAIRLLS